MELSDLQKLCVEMVELRKAKDDLAEQTKTVNKKLAGMMGQAVEHLEEHGLRRFDFGAGKISVTEKRSVKVLDKFKLFDWLRSKDIFESIVSVNSQTINKIYKDEFEAAQENGDIDFLSQGIPGLSEPTTFQTIRFLK